MSIAGLVGSVRWLPDFSWDDPSCCLVVGTDDDGDETKSFTFGRERRELIERFTKCDDVHYFCLTNLSIRFLSLFMENFSFVSIVCIQQKMRVSNILSRYSDLKEENILTLTNQHSFKVSQFHKMLKSTYGKTLAKLQVSLDTRDVRLRFSKIFLASFSGDLLWLLITIFSILEHVPQQQRGKLCYILARHRDWASVRGHVRWHWGEDLLRSLSMFSSAIDIASRCLPRLRNHVQRRSHWSR